MCIWLDYHPLFHVSCDFMPHLPVAAVCSHISSQKFCCISSTVLYSLLIVIHTKRRCRNALTSPPWGFCWSQAAPPPPLPWDGTSAASPPACNNDTGLCLGLGHSERKHFLGSGPTKTGHCAGFSQTDTGGRSRLGSGQIQTRHPFLVWIND